MKPRKKPDKLAKCPRCEKLHTDFDGLYKSKFTGAGVPRLYCKVCRNTLRYFSDSYYSDSVAPGRSLDRRRAAL